MSVSTVSANNRLSLKTLVPISFLCSALISVDGVEDQQPQLVSREFNKTLV